MDATMSASMCVFVAPSGMKTERRNKVIISQSDENEAHITSSIQLFVWSDGLFKMMFQSSRFKYFMLFVLCVQ